MQVNQSTSVRSIGFTGLLTIAFVVLKLCNVIQWSWWWVLSPLWITTLLVVLGIIFFVICAVISKD